MARYNRLLDQVLAAGPHEVIESFGFKCNKPRLYVREHEDRTEFIEFYRHDKYGIEEFSFCTGVFYTRFDALYRELFPDGLEGIRFTDSIWSGPPHVETAASEICLAKVEESTTPPPRYDITIDREQDEARAIITKYPAFSETWDPTPDNLDDIAVEVIAYCRDYVLPWFDRMADPLFAASWRLAQFHSSWYCKMFAALFHRFAGDDDGACALIAELTNEPRHTLDELEQTFIHPRWFGLVKGKSTEETRDKAVRAFQTRQEQAERARRLARAFGCQT